MRVPCRRRCCRRWRRRPAGSLPHWPHLERQQALLRAALEGALQRGSSGFNVLLHGGPGTGKTEFARQLVAEIGASAFVVQHADDEGDEASRQERLASLRLSQTFAGEQQRAVLVLDEAEDIFQNDYQSPLARLFRRSTESKAWMNSLLETNPHPVIWISNRVAHLDPAYLRRFSFCLEFPQTPYAVRQRIARERLATLGCSEGLVDALAAVPEVTPALLDSAARFAELSAGSDFGFGVDEAVRLLIDGHLKAAGHAEAPLAPRRTTRFDMRYLNVAGNATPERVLAALRALGRRRGAVLRRAGHRQDAVRRRDRAAPGPPAGGAHGLRHPLEVVRRVGGQRGAHVPRLRPEGRAALPRRGGSAARRARGRRAPGRPGGHGRVPALARGVPGHLRLRHQPRGGVRRGADAALHLPARLPAARRRAAPGPLPRAGPRLAPRCGRSRALRRTPRQRRVWPASTG